MWKRIKHSSTNQANLARRKLDSIGADKVIVVDATETMVEFMTSNKGNNKKKRKQKRDNDRRVEQVVRDTDGRITSKKPNPLTLDEWELAPCGLGVVNNNVGRHRGSCRKCNEILSPTPVNAAASRSSGWNKSTKAQQEITDIATAANDFNQTQPVKSTKKERETLNGFDSLLSYLKSGLGDVMGDVSGKEVSFKESMEIFRDFIIKKSASISDRYGAQIHEVNKIIDEITRVEEESRNELRAIDEEIIRRQKELEQLIKDRDIKTGASPIDHGATKN